jgi:hypothetical protein
MVLMLERMENYILGGILETEEQKDSLLNEILEKQEIESGTKAGEAEIRVIGSPVPGKTLAQVTPLLLVEWDQGTPYNNNVGGKCSGDGPAENGKYWAGCVATSVAQIMAYWKYPAKIDNYSFNWNTLNQYTANPTRVGLNMASKYAIDNAPENVKNQIATLFQKIGNGVGMNYGCKGSSAKQDDAISFLKKQGYKADGINEFYPYLAETSLNKKRPLLAEGCAIKKNHKILGITLFATYDGCHSWVIDGYLTKELKYKAQIGMSIYNVVSSVSYFHHNWGWSGSRNGYLESGIFNSNLVPNFPSNTKAGEPYNYQYKIKVVPNIYK